MSTPVKIIVVGGSYAGVLIIRQLLALKVDAKITLIERRDARYHTHGASRSMVDAEYGEKVWVPYTSLFPENSEHKVIQDTLKHVYHHHIVLESGTNLPFDYLFLCTGSDNPAPGKFGGITASAEANTISNKARSDLSSSNSVLVVGGGGSGVELAGEIKTAYPSKDVTLVHSGSTLADYSGFAQNLKSSALNHLRGLGVKVVLEERVTIEGLDREHSIRVGQNVFKTKSGETIESEIQFLTSGNKVDTSYISTLKPEGNDSFDSSTLVNSGNNTIKVRKTLQLADEAFPYIFAVGDCSDFSKVPIAADCDFIAPTAVKNLIQVIDSAVNQGKAVKLMDASGAPAYMVLTTGPKTGVSSLPLFGSRFGNFFATLLKSKDLNLGKVYSEMNVQQN
ncbi:hypothetical protein BGZ76_001995 [Entomortierella beljakovae]|nr:hypothetical protein BGZ76_001995 [Entomortierella beljakovae]